MTIELKRVVPIPLKEKLLQKPSAIWNTDLIFKSGNFIKIMAPSGTGKTTLIHILYQLRNDFEGDILFDGVSVKEITGEGLAQIRREQISIVFQDLRLFPNLTIRENIELKRVLTKPMYPEDKIDWMANELGITHILHQKAGICSYGEQQRVAIIRALMQPFSWLILDEPYSHLDNINIRKSVNLIQEECKKRDAGIIITDLESDNYFNYSQILNL